MNKIVNLLFILVLTNNVLSQEFTHYFDLNQAISCYTSGDTLWVGTDVGLVGWDINSEKVICHYHEGNSNLFDNVIKEIGKDSSGNLWVKGASSVSWKTGGKWQNHQFLDSRGSARAIKRLAFGRKGHVAVSTYGGIYVHQSGSWYKVVEKNHYRSGCRILIDDKDYLWYKGDKYERLECFNLSTMSPAQTEEYTNPIYDLFIDSKERKWIGQLAGYTLCKEGGSLNLSLPSSAQSCNKFIVEDNNGTIWFDADYYIGKYKNDTISKFDIQSFWTGKGLPYPDLGKPIDVVIDKDKVWILMTKCLYNLTEDKCYMYDNLVDALVNDKYIGNSGFVNGKLFIITNECLLLFERENFKKVIHPSKISGNEFQLPQLEDNGSVWVNGDVLHLFRNGTIDVFPVGVSGELQFDKSRTAWGKSNDNEERVFSITQEGKFTQFEIFEKYKYSRREPVLITGLDYTYLFGSKGSYVFAKGKWQETGVIPQSRSYYCALQNDKYAWIALDSLYLYKKGRLQNSGLKFDTRPYFEDRMKVGYDGNIWLVPNRTSLYRIDKKNKLNKVNLDAVINDVVADDEMIRRNKHKQSDVIEDLQTGMNSVLLDLNESVAVLYKDGFVEGKNANGSIIEDANGNWWYVSDENTSLIVKIAPKGVEEVDLLKYASNLKYLVVTARFADSKGNMVFTSTHNVFLCKGNEDVVNIDISKFLPKTQITSVVEAPNDIYYVGTRDGLLKINEGNIEVLTTKNGLFSKAVKDLKICDGELWLYYNYGFSKMSL